MTEIWWDLTMMSAYQMDIIEMMYFDVYCLIPDWESRIQLYALFYTFTKWLLEFSMCWTRPSSDAEADHFLLVDFLVPKRTRNWDAFIYIYISEVGGWFQNRYWHDTPINPHFHGFSTLLSSLNINFQLVLGRVETGSVPNDFGTHDNGNLWESTSYASRFQIL